MKKLLSYLLCGIAIVIVFNSCKKDANLTQNNSGSIDEHSLGALLDHDTYMNTPKIDIEAMKLNMVRNGYTIPRAVTSATGIILNHPAIGDQGQTGTCVSWSTGWTLSGTLNNEFPIAGVNNPRSPWWVYQINHTATGDRRDDGMYVYAGMDIIKNNGVPDYSLDNTLGRYFYRFKPTAAQIASAATDKISSYAAVTTLADLKAALNLRHPVEMGLSWYRSFDSAWSYHTTATRMLGGIRGGHAVCVIGYDDAKNAVLIQNSWGTSGGDLANPGCMWFDYGLLFNSNLGYEYYSATR